MPAGRQEMSDEGRLTGLTQHVDPHPRATGKEVLVTEQAETCLPELGFDLGLVHHRLRLRAFGGSGLAPEAALKLNRDNHRVTTDAVKLAEHGQPMLGTRKMLE